MTSSPHFANDREAAEGMRLIRAWEVIRVLNSRDGNHELAQALRLRSNHPARKDMMGIEQVASIPLHFIEATC